MPITDFLLSDGELQRLLTKFPELRADPNDYCPTCSKTGTYRWEGQDHPCDCSTQLRLYKKYLSSGIGKPYQRLTWDDVDPELDPHLEPIYKFLNDPEKYISRGMGVYLWGPPGTGKTMIARVVDNVLSSLAATMAGMVEYFTAGWGGKTDEKQWFTEKFLSSQILVLDELRRDNRLAESTFDHILRTRVHEGRPTIITTNLTPTELENGYGSSILSLIVEQSIVVNLDRQNYRGQAHDRLMKEIDLGEIRPIL